MHLIKTCSIKESTVTVPGSKSFTHRILIAAALSDGRCEIFNPLASEDTALTMSGLKQMGVQMDEGSGSTVVQGVSGRLKACNAPIYLGNSGTSIRLLTGICALGEGEYVLDGTARMQQRPIQDLIDGLNQLGVHACAIHGNGCPPIRVPGGIIHGGSVRLKCGVSSQFLSSLLLLAPYTANGLKITVIEGPVSKPYVDMTIDVMETLGVSVDREGYQIFSVAGGQMYRAGNYTVEPDCSQASYFWGAAAICGASVTVRGISLMTRQGDIRFLDILAAMGCGISETPEGVRVAGGPLKGVDVEMADMPDMVPTLAVIAAFAEGTTSIRNVAHLKAKESDRLGAVVTELNKMGVEAHCTDSGMVIHGGLPHGAEVETYDDHRMAMSFAMAGLKIPGVTICHPECVSKSFPNFWEVFETLYK